MQCVVAMRYTSRWQRRRGERCTRVGDDKRNGDRIEFAMKHIFGDFGCEMFSISGFSCNNHSG